jgi:radical SAM-linked protein
LLNQFQRLLTSGEAEGKTALSLIQDLHRFNLAEEALLWFRQENMGQRFPQVRRDLEAAATLSRDRRAAQWHLDAERLHLRIRYSRRSPLQLLNPPQTQALIGRLFGDAGFTPALGLGKHPRPMVALGHPLPVDTEGLEEWADIVLQRRPPGTSESWLPALNKVAPPGLAIGAVEPVPAYASPVLDLSREAHWAWPCPADQLVVAQARTTAFLASTSFELEKPGKAGGAKILKKVEVRSLVKSMRWESDLLDFVLALSPGEALNPRKLLGGILGVNPETVAGLVRRRVVLRDDPRLDKPEKFEPKLKNIFEDAVLLGENSNLVIVDEEEDDPIVLG